MWGMSIAHWIVVVGVVVVLFGRGRISALMADIGGGLREFKKAAGELVNGEESPKAEVEKFVAKVKDPLK